MMQKARKVFGFLYKLQNTLASSSLLTVYISFTRSYLSDRGIAFNKLFNE